MPYCYATRVKFWSDPSDPRHGSLNGYTNLRCRCDRCTAAATRHRADWKASRAGLPVPEGKHGIICYKDYKCGCEVGRQAWRDAENARMARIRDGGVRGWRIVA